MEVAAGITGFVCAVGQACQVAAQLHTFFASITDAPARIVQLSEKLDALHSVLARINDIATSLDAECGVEVPADVELALKRTLRKLEDVRRVVRKYDVGIERDGTKWKVKRSWMKIKWAFKEEEVARICGELEAEKAGLGLALQSLGLAVDSMQMKQMEGLQTSMQGLLQTSRTHTELVKSHVDSRFISLERSLNTISGHVEKANTHNMMPEEIMSMIQATVTKSVQEAMTNAMLTGNTPMFGNAFSETPFNLSRESTLYGGEEMRREYSGSTLTGSFSEDDNWKDWKGWPEEMDDIETVCVEPIDKVRFVVPNTDQATKSITRSLRYRHYRRIPTSLGLLLVFYTTASSSSMNWDHGPGERLSSSVFEMGFTFIPAAWLFATAISASFTKTTRFTPSPINDMNINFKSFNVVPTTADVMLYARLGDTLKLRELFSQRIASPNDRDVHGRTPLHWAAAMGNLETCQLLLQHGADPAVPNEMARTPLHWTTFLSCSADVIRLLISAGCDPDIPNVGGQSSLFSTGGTNYAAVLDAMLNQDHFLVDIDQGDNWGRTPLMWVVGSEKEENLDSISALIKKGASVTRMDKQGLTPLHLCLLSATPGLSKKESIIALLRAGADPRAASEELGGLTVTDIAKHNGVLSTWIQALEECRLDFKTVMRERESEAVVATAIGRVKKNMSMEEEQGMKVESVLKRRKRIMEVDDDEAELDEAKRNKIEEIPRRVQYELFEGGPGTEFDQKAAPNPTGNQSTHPLRDYQMQLLALEQQNKRRMYRARAEQDNLCSSTSSKFSHQRMGPESTPSHTYHSPAHLSLSNYGPHPTTTHDFYHSESNPMNNHTETRSSTGYTATPMETSPLPSYITPKNPPDRRDVGKSYSSTVPEICKESMNEQSSCQPMGGNQIPIRNKDQSHAETEMDRLTRLSREATELRRMKEARISMRRLQNVHAQYAYKIKRLDQTIWLTEEQKAEQRRKIEAKRHIQLSRCQEKISTPVSTPVPRTIAPGSSAPPLAWQQEMTWSTSTLQKEDPALAYRCDRTDWRQRQMMSPQQQQAANPYKTSTEILQQKQAIMQVQQQAIMQAQQQAANPYPTSTEIRQRQQYSHTEREDLRYFAQLNSGPNNVPVSY